MNLSRVLLFLIGCIGIRSALTYYSYFLSICNTSNFLCNSNFLPVLGKIALIPAIGFILIYFLDLRKTGPEVFGETIWWNNLRPIHGILWGIFAFMTHYNPSNAWIALAADTILGLSAFLMHHFL